MRAPQPPQPPQPPWPTQPTQPPLPYMEEMGSCSMPLALSAHTQASSLLPRGRHRRVKVQQHVCGERERERDQQQPRSYLELGLWRRAVAVQRQVVEGVPDRVLYVVQEVGHRVALHLRVPLFMLAISTCKNAAVPQRARGPQRCAQCALLTLSALAHRGALLPASLLIRRRPKSLEFPPHSRERPRARGHLELSSQGMYMRSISLRTQMQPARRGRGRRRKRRRRGGARTLRSSKRRSGGTQEGARGVPKLLFLLPTSEMNVVTAW